MRFEYFKMLIKRFTKVLSFFFFNHYIKKVISIKELRRSFVRRIASPYRINEWTLGQNGIFQININQSFCYIDVARRAPVRRSTSQIFDFRFLHSLVAGCRAVTAEARVQFPVEEKIFYYYFFFSIKKI